MRAVIHVYNSVMTTSGMTQPLLSITPKLLCWRDLYRTNKDKDGNLFKGTDNSLKKQICFKIYVYCIRHGHHRPSWFTVLLTLFTIQP